MSRKARLLRLATGFALVLTLVAITTPSYGYRMIQNLSTGRVTAGSQVSCANLLGFTHWLTNETEWYNNTSGQGFGKTTALVNAMNTWTSVSTATQVLTYRGTTGAGFTTDGQNTLSWGTGQGCSGTCLALTALVLLPGQIIIESDVTFNNAVTWTTNGTNFDTQAVATHELGHALGIHHTNQTLTFPRPTMYQNYSGSGMRSLESDDRAALNCLHQVYFLFTNPPMDDPEDPPPGNPVRVISEHCRGLVTVEWDAIPGAVRYELYKSSSSSFTSQIKVYDGTALRKFLDAGFGTSYFRLRGCNEDFCGAYRNGNQPFTYNSGCF